jgi:hypothetical protein
MTAALTQVDLTRRNHRRAVRFFWGWLILATWVLTALAGDGDGPPRWPADDEAQGNSPVVLGEIPHL